MKFLKPLNQTKRKWLDIQMRYFHVNWSSHLFLLPQILSNLVAITRLLEHLSQNKGQISAGTFVHAIFSFKSWWSTVGEVEKKANADLVSLVNVTVKDLKKAFSM
jgi:hypothetical protein